VYVNTILDHLQHVLLQEGKGKGNGTGKGKVKGKLSKSGTDNTVIGLGKHVVDVQLSLPAKAVEAVEGDIASLQLSREIADESDKAGRELAVALKALNEDRGAHYREFKWHV
jgi:hypothetical protein